MRARSRTLTTIAAVVLVSVACSPPTPPQRSVEGLPGLAHVHGLGVDPADGVLYAAGHHGLFRVPADAEAERVGDLLQDTMGFTVVGPGHFLGSGHPDPRDTAAPPHLGLIESVDAGNSWRSLSLAGEADFHALEAKHGLVYGYDSRTGQLAVSSDHRSWDRRPKTALADFTVSPSNPDVLVAITEHGPARSTDGGRTFAPIEGAPLLRLVDWPTGESIVGVTPDGAVHASADGGTTWTARGRVPGKPSALVADSSGEVHLATATAIHSSGDGGQTFTLRHTFT